MTHPCNMEIEDSTLGAMISSAEYLDLCLTSLSSAHFFAPRARKVFETLSQMALKSLHVDPGTVFNEIGTQDTDLRDYLFKISVSFPPMGEMEYFISELNEKLLARKLIELSETIQAEAPKCQDVKEFLSNVEIEVMDMAQSRQSDNLLQSSCDKVFDQIQAIREGRGVGAVKTGIEAIDFAIQGVVPGMMDVYAAEAGCGKTSLAEMMIISFLLEARPVVVFQRDMTPQGFIFRLACRLANVSVSAIRNYGHKMKPELDEVERRIKQLEKLPFKLYSPDGCTGADVRSIVRREKRRNSIELVVIDHMRTLRHTKSNSWDGLEENSNAIRQSTNETGVSHVVLTHINRTGAKSDRPTISDIKGGDQLKDDSDNCCVMWAPEGRPEKETGIRTWKVNFAFDKTRWDWNSIETMNYHGPKMKFEKI